MEPLLESLQVCWEMFLGSRGGVCTVSHVDHEQIPVWLITDIITLNQSALRQCWVNWGGGGEERCPVPRTGSQSITVSFLFFISYVHLWLLCHTFYINLRTHSLPDCSQHYIHTSLVTDVVSSCERSCITLSLHYVPMQQCQPLGHTLYTHS